MTTPETALDSICDVIDWYVGPYPSEETRTPDEAIRRIQKIVAPVGLSPREMAYAEALEMIRVKAFYELDECRYCDSDFEEPHEDYCPGAIAANALRPLSAA